MTVELITRKEARQMGLTIGRMDYLLKIGKLQYVPETKSLFNKSDVERILEIPKWQGYQEKVRVARGHYVTNKHLNLAISSLGICAQLLKNPGIKKHFRDASVQDLLGAAKAFEHRLNAKKERQGA